VPRVAWGRHRTPRRWAKGRKKGKRGLGFIPPCGFVLSKFSRCIGAASRKKVCPHRKCARGVVCRGGEEVRGCGPGRRPVKNRMAEKGGGKSLKKMDLGQKKAAISNNQFGCRSESLTKVELKPMLKENFEGQGEETLRERNVWGQYQGVELLSTNNGRKKKTHKLIRSRNQEKPA